MWGSMSGEYAVSATNQLLLVLTGGFVSSLVCGYATCNVASSCTGSMTCQSVPGGICSFKNRAGITTESVYLFRESVYLLNASADALSGLLTGLCSPGDRWQTNPVTGDVECVPFFPFPNAINTEIMDMQATDASGKACGKWINAGGAVNTVYRRGTYDNDDWISELERVEDVATSSSRLAHSGMAKFRAECQRTATVGAPALRSSAAMAFRYFEDYIEANSADRNGFLRSLGFISGHYCETPVRMLIVFDNATFTARLSDGFMFGPTTLSDALHLFNEPIEVQSSANEASAQITDWYQRRESQDLTPVERYQVMVGASDQSSPSYTDNSDDTTLPGAALRYYDENPEKAVSLLKGLGAFCSFESFSNWIDYDSSVERQSVYARLKVEMNAIRSSKPTATALGRLKQVGDADKIDSVDQILKASGITWASVVGRGSTGNPSVDCLALMRVVFADEVESARFDEIVSADLYSRLQPLVLSVRVAMGLAAETAPLNATISDTSKLEQVIAEAGVRMVGAPRGSWAGESLSIPRAEISSEDGMFLMMIKQSRANFKHNIIDTVTNPSLSACDHQPLYSQLTWNAYAMSISNTYCSVFFLGLAHRPLMDQFYDNASMASRSLFAVAHEFAHFAELSGLTNRSSMNNNGLMRHYYTVTHTEAYADVFAAVAILTTGLVTRADFDLHHCQVWCSRQPWWYTQPPNEAHPVGNDRCNLLIRTLDEFYPTLGR